MTYDEFKNYVKEKCSYETIYNDSEGREILVIKTLDAWRMVKNSNPIINEPIIDALKLNTRAENCLAYEGVVTVADLIMKLANQKLFLKKMPNMGKKTEQLILDELARIGFPINTQDGEK